MKADYTLGGGWGYHVTLSKPEQFKNTDFNTELLKVWGHYTPRPQKKQTLLIEGHKSFMLFEFVEIEYCSNPDDMFFAELKFLDQELKEKEEAVLDGRKK